MFYFIGTVSYTFFFILIFAYNGAKLDVTTFMLFLIGSLALLHEEIITFFTKEGDKKKFENYEELVTELISNKDDNKKLFQSHGLSQKGNLKDRLISSLLEASDPVVCKRTENAVFFVLFEIYNQKVIQKQGEGYSFISTDPKTILEKIGMNRNELLYKLKESQIIEAEWADKIELFWKKCAEYLKMSVLYEEVNYIGYSELIQRKYYETVSNTEILKSGIILISGLFQKYIQ